MDSFKIADCMTTDFVRFQPTTLVIEAVHELVKHEVIGGPVVDQEGELLGWISEQDCLKPAIETVYHNTSVSQVKDVMQSPVLTVRDSDEIMSLAQQMRQQKPKVYPVLNAENKLIGVTSRRLVLRALDTLMGHFAPEALAHREVDPRHVELVTNLSNEEGWH